MDGAGMVAAQATTAVVTVSLAETATAMETGHATTAVVTPEPARTTGAGTVLVHAATVVMTT
jgi:hypothetical protein